MNWKLVIALGCIVLVLFIAAIAFDVRVLGPLVRPVATMLDPRPHNEACAALAEVAEPRMRRFISRYRMVERIYGRGMGACDPNAPNVRYEFLGHYRPNESHDAFLAKLMEPLAVDGWRRGPDGLDGPTARLRAKGIAMIATLLYSGSDVPSVSPNFRAPELFDVNVEADHPIANARGTLPEEGGHVAESMLAQMTLFYPKPLPSGISIDDSSSERVSDHSSRVYSIFDVERRRSTVDESPAPRTMRSTCDVFGSFGEPRSCPRVGTSRRGLPIYVARHRRPGGTDRYGLIDGDTAIVILSGWDHKPPIDRRELFEVIDSLEPTNLERKRL